jgi:hypothetical protein
VVFAGREKKKEEEEGSSREKLLITKEGQLRFWWGALESDC